MLPITASANLRHCVGRTLITPTGHANVSASPSLSRCCAINGLYPLNTRIKARPPAIIFCRFRHVAKSSRLPRDPTDFSPRPQYRSALESRGRPFGGLEFNPHWEQAALKKALERFILPHGMQGLLESLGTPRDKAKELIIKFSEKAIDGEIAAVNKKMIGIMAKDSLEVGMTFRTMGVTREEAIASKLDKALWHAFFVESEGMLPLETQSRLSRMREIADLRHPAEWTPRARLLKRKIIMHVGPTNSGKTHNALIKLREAESGAYLSPLRLLAHEIFDRMNASGTPCNLVTGEERRYGVYNEKGEPMPYAAKVTSCTVEMVSFERRIDVAVIDEIQMLADPERGWAWTAALLGLPAKEIHLCGEPTVVKLVENICKLTNEEVIVNRYDRLSKLEVQDESLRGNLKKVQKGDCVVTFSRKNIFMLKQAIEAETGLRCAVAYGGLPPESRSAQAKLFNDPTSGYDVLVASDAIGMGLNLNIRRIIFEALEKFDGQNVRQLSLTQIKQIAGRAGRFGTEYAIGKATTLLQSDIPILKRALATPMIEIPRAGIQPLPEKIEEFSVQMPGAPFSHVLKMFEMMSLNSRLFFPSLLKNMIQSAEVLDHINLPVRIRIPFTSAPIQTRDIFVVAAAQKMARAVSTGRPLTIDEVANLPKEKAKKDDKLMELKHLETTHRIIMLYLWLSQRFPAVMQGGIESDASKRKKRCEDLIEIALKEKDHKRVQKIEDKKKAKTAKAAKVPKVPKVPKAGSSVGSNAGASTEAPSTQQS